MDKVHAINPRRIAWCCDQQGLLLDQLGRELRIAPATLRQVMEGKDAISINQLGKIAAYFNRGILFFLEPGPVSEAKLHTPQFRTLTNQKPTLSPRLTTLIERTERQRKVYIDLLEELGEDVERDWYPSQLTVETTNVKGAAVEVRRWLGLGDEQDFSELRGAVETKGILVFVSNGYQGHWQIAKENPVRGFSLYFASFPLIAIKKQSTDGPQAFTLMHELAHLLLHRASMIDDEEDFHTYQGKERAANQFAGNLLVPDHLLERIDLREFPTDEVTAYDGFLKECCRRWCVSTEVILHRLLDEGLLGKECYQAYRRWKQSLPLPAQGEGGMRYRYREPVHMFGEPFVRTVLDALNGKVITLTRASSYLDDLRITDVRRLEETYGGT